MNDTTLEVIAKEYRNHLEKLVKDGFKSPCHVSSYIHSWGGQSINVSIPWDDDDSPIEGETLQTVEEALVALGLLANHLLHTGQKVYLYLSESSLNLSNYPDSYEPMDLEENPTNPMFFLQDDIG